MTLDDASTKLFCSRMVTLILGILDGRSKLVRASASGFLLQLGERWWIVTAGHVVQTLREQNEAKTLRYILSCDAWKGLDGRGLPVSLPCDPSKWLELGDNDELDWGAIEIGPLIAANLSAGTIVPVTQEEIEQPDPPFEFFVLLGTPGELIDDNGDPTAPLPWSITRGVAKVERIARPSYVQPVPHDRFYARLAQDSAGFKVNSIAGTSGGPILGCWHHGGELRVKVIAIQSGWWESDKVIVGDLLREMIPELERRSRISGSD